MCVCVARTWQYEANRSASTFSCLSVLNLRALVFVCFAFVGSPWIYLIPCSLLPGLWLWLANEILESTKTWTMAVEWGQAKKIKNLIKMCTHRVAFFHQFRSNFRALFCPGTMSFFGRKVHRNKKLGRYMHTHVVWWRMNLWFIRKIDWFSCIHTAYQTRFICIT